MATINRMRNLTSERTYLITITWFLTGLLLTGCLLNSLPTLKGSAACAEERVLEIDDDRSDQRDLDCALHLPNEERSASQTWHEVQVFYCAATSQIEFGANFGRGPPRC